MSSRSGRGVTTIITPDGETHVAEQAIFVIVPKRVGKSPEVGVGIMGTMSITLMVHMLEHMTKGVLQRIDELCAEQLCSRCDRLNECSDYLDRQGK